MDLSSKSVCCLSVLATDSKSKSENKQIVCSFEAYKIFEALKAHIWDLKEAFVVLFLIQDDGCFCHHREGRKFRNDKNRRPHITHFVWTDDLGPLLLELLLLLPF